MAAQAALSRDLGIEDDVKRYAVANEFMGNRIFFRQSPTHHQGEPD